MIRPADASTMVAMDDEALTTFLGLLPPGHPGDLEVTGAGALPSAFSVTDLATAAVAAAALAAARLIEVHTGRRPHVEVDRRLSSLWFGWSLHPDGWQLPPPWDPIAGDYRTTDGWIKVHTNAPDHRDAALAVLGSEPDREAVAKAVGAWSAEALETAIVEGGGVAAMFRSPVEWAAHPQGRSVGGEPIVHRRTTARAPRLLAARSVDTARPLAGVKVLDLTRVLAGPVATRFLAGLGADVLRLDPPWWDEPGVVPEVTLGKRCARIDLRSPQHRAVFETLLGRTDILVHGYRGDALERLGFGAATRATLGPGLVDVSLDAYGWSGPWAHRRGFDSLVQMSSGIAWKEADRSGSARPGKLPVQALDHAAGYVMAAAALHGWCDRLEAGTGSTHQTSLARVATLLLDGPPGDPSASLAGPVTDDLAPGIERTAWGPARRLRSPIRIDGHPLAWSLPAGELGSTPLSDAW